MLFVSCSFCPHMAPMYCAGTFPPHVPVAVEATPMGPYCPYCGPGAPAFQCPMCGTVQYLLLPGMAAPARPAFGGAQQFAPVVQAPPAASKSQLRLAFEAVIQGAASSGGKAWGHEMGQAFGQDMGAWTGSQ